MARLRNEATGAVVSVRDEKVELLGAGWVSADEQKKAPAKKSASSKSEK